MTARKAHACRRHGFYPTWAQRARQWAASRSGSSTTSPRHGSGGSGVRRELRLAGAMVLRGSLVGHSATRVHGGVVLEAEKAADGDNTSEDICGCCRLGSQARIFIRA
jgi:hypothetical protein